ncbi:hypothetical protein GBL_3332 [Geobacillus kaustophilus GBlys]|uniref:Uncharacterized protein n=1 Tax=Geobacillus kaustophilus GBlys TaxID=1337888 RepID=U2X824_GEOKU|nr:hypothetical protein GBL_3332 [Geobacillus kaustophilus GBlys]
MDYRVRHIRTVKRYGAVVLLSCVYSIAESQQDLSAGLELLRYGKATASLNSFHREARDSH